MHRTTRALLALAALTIPAQSVVAQTITSGFTPYDDQLIAARYRSLANSGGRELYLSTADLGSGSFRTEIDIVWAIGNNDFSFTWDPINDEMISQVVNANGTYVLTYPNVSVDVSSPFDLTDMNVMQITVAERQAGVTVDVEDAELDGIPLGDFGVGTTGFEDWMVTDYDFGAGFVLTGTLVLAGPLSSSQELNRVDVRVGVLVPCGDGILDPGEDCDDGNNDDGDCCASDCSFETGSCDDGSVCTTVDTCDGAGTCVGGTPLDCSDGDLCTIDQCDPVAGCSNLGAAQAGCRTARSSVLAIYDRSVEKRDSFSWRWGRGEATSQQEFSDPTATSDYGVCLYSGTSDTLVASVTVAADPDNWRATGNSGYSYKDRGGDADGIRRLLLRESNRPTTRIRLRAKGDNLQQLSDIALPAPASVFPLTIQLVNESEGVCWESVFEASDVRANKTDRLRLRSRGR